MLPGPTPNLYRVETGLCVRMDLTCSFLLGGSEGSQVAALVAPSPLGSNPSMVRLSQASRGTERAAPLLAPKGTSKLSGPFVFPLVHLCLRALAPAIPYREAPPGRQGVCHTLLRILAQVPPSQ